MRKHYHTSSQNRETCLNRSSRPRRSSHRSSQPAGGSSNTRITVRDHDVKAGKGHGSTSHPGNQYYLQRVQEQKIFYRNQESNKGKTAVAKVIIEMIECRGGRFVEEINGEWEIIPSDRVERKVKQALRDMSASTSSSIVKKNKNEVQSNSNSISETDHSATSNMSTSVPESSQNQVLNNIPSPSIAIEEKITASTCRDWKPKRHISRNVRTEKRSQENTESLDLFHNECEQRILDEDHCSKTYTKSKFNWGRAKPFRQPSTISSLNTDAKNDTVFLDKEEQDRCTQSGIPPLNRSEMEEMMINLRGNSMDDDIDKDDDDVLLPIDDSVWDS